MWNRVERLMVTITAGDIDDGENIFTFVCKCDNCRINIIHNYIYWLLPQTLGICVYDCNEGAVILSDDVRDKYQHFRVWLFLGNDWRLFVKFDSFCVQLFPGTQSTGITWY